MALLITFSPLKSLPFLPVWAQCEAETNGHADRQLFCHAEVYKDPHEEPLAASPSFPLSNKKRLSLRARRAQLSSPSSDFHIELPDVRVQVGTALEA